VEEVEAVDATPTAAHVLAVPVRPVILALALTLEFARLALLAVLPALTMYADPAIQATP
jgi:hypothetical protein